MILSLRTHRPDDAVNKLSLAFDYSADLASLEVARDLLAAEQDKLAALEATVPPPGDGPYGLTRVWAECELSRVTVTLLAGAVAQAEAAVATYPADIAEYAVARFEHLTGRPEQS